MATALFEESSEEEEDEFNFDFAPFILGHKKELAFYSAICFAIFSLIGFLFVVDEPEKAEHAKQVWAKQTWLQTNCTLEAVGLAYRGDCEPVANLKTMERVNYTECMGERETKDDAKKVESIWESSAAGRCARRGDIDWKADTAMHRPDFEDEEERAPDVTKRGRRLRWNAVHELCSNDVLPWALLRPMNVSSSGDVEFAVGTEKRCAYQLGAARPSITDDWVRVEEILAPLWDGLKSHQALDCWFLKADNCVVAFSEPRGISAEDRIENSEVLVGMVICIWLTVLSLALAAYWHAQDLGLTPSTGPGGGYMTVSTRVVDEGGREAWSPSPENRRTPMVSQRHEDGFKVRDDGWAS